VLLAVVFTMPPSANAAVSQTLETTAMNEGVPQPIKYVFYMPDARPGESFHVLVATHGLGVDPEIFLRPEWTAFADKERFAIIGLGFKFVPEDWAKQRSYQFAGAWSGGALDDILRRITREQPVNPRELYLYGVSAGAQFSTRYAFLHPDTVKAAAVNSAGWYDYPKRYIPVRFLLTVGEKDNAAILRVEFAKRFLRRSKRRGIDAQLRIIPGIGHVQTPAQDELSRKFLRDTRYLADRLTDSKQ